MILEALIVAVANKEAYMALVLFLNGKDVKQTPRLTVAHNFWFAGFNLVACLLLIALIAEVVIASFGLFQTSTL